MEEIFDSQILELLIIYGHIVTIPLVMVMGRPLAIVAALLAQIGVFHALPTLVAIYVGGFLGKVMWFMIGHGSRHALMRFKTLRPIAERIDSYSTPEVQKRLRSHLFFTIFAIDMTMVPVFFPTFAAIAAHVEISFKRMFSTMALTQIIVAGMDFCIGYFLVGSVVENPERLLSEIGIIIALVVVIYILFRKYFKPYIARYVSVLSNGHPPSQGSDTLDDTTR